MSLHSKVWALTVSKDESTVVSGGADSFVTFWEDSTEEIERENETKREEVAQRFVSAICINTFIHTGPQRTRLR